MTCASPQPTVPSLRRARVTTYPDPIGVSSPTHRCTRRTGRPTTNVSSAASSRMRAISTDLNQLVVRTDVSGDRIEAGLRDHVHVLDVKTHFAGDHVERLHRER